MSLLELSEALREKAKRELNEEPDRIEDGINHIKNWAEKEAHLNPRLDNQWILNFLRCCKFSIQRAKERIDFFYTLRTLTPEFFADRDPFAPEIQDILSKRIIAPFVKPITPDGPILLTIRWALGDPNKNSFINVMKVVLMMFDILLVENPNFSVSGLVAITDFKDYPLHYLTQKTPSAIKKIILSVQNAYPIRLKFAPCVNVAPVVDTLFNIAGQFFNDKIRARVKLYRKDDFNKILEDIPLDALPKQYGGNGGCMDEMADFWKKKLESYSDWFKNDAKYFSDESKRLGKPKTTADIFGVEGSFRKLNVD